MAFDFTPKFTHGPIHPDFSNDSFVDALNTEYNDNGDYWDTILPTPFKPRFDPTGIWTAAITLGSWFEQQRPGCNGPGCTYDNPFEVPFSNAEKKDILSLFGFDCDSSAMFDSYNANRKSIISLQNTYYNLGKGEKSFSWENGCLCLRDKYNFEGIGDFGGGDPIGLAASLIVLAPIVIRATSNAVVRGILKSLGNDYREEDDPFTAFKRGDLQIGSAAPLYLKNCFCPTDVDENNDPIFCNTNPLLYMCAVRSGKIEYDPSSQCFSGDSCIEVGNAQSSPILGLPSYSPNVMEITTDEGSLSFGDSSNYPSPFTSFSQQLVNSNNFLGAYAMIGGISGRLIVIPSGTYAGELGFACQNWYGFDDGQYAKDANGDLYPTKAQWWDTCLKSEMTVRFLPFQNRPLVKVMVATKSFSDNNSQEVFSSDFSIGSASDGSVLLSNVITSLPAATLTLI